MRTLLIPLCLFSAPLLEAATLPDTGQQLCYDGTNMVACTAANSGDAATYPGQDGRFGRDAAATAGQLSKIGGGDAGFDYTRICNSGEPEGTGSCPANMTSADIGTGANQWGCTLDNLTGLMWEVKVNDNTHLRHKDWTYTWYSSDSTTNGGYAGTADTGTGVGSDNCLDPARCDTEKYVADVNTANLCGYSDWRMPSRLELQTLTHLGRFNPAIDIGYFPNTVPSHFWSASSYAGSRGVAWIFDFNHGYISGYSMRYDGQVRLVRSGQF